MSKFSKFSKFLVKLKQAQVVAIKAAPYIQSVVAVSILANETVPSKHQARINAVLHGVSKDVQAVRVTLERFS